MDPLTIVSLVSAIVQFVDFGIKVVERLNEYRDGANKIPDTFRNISIQLPLLIDTLKQTQIQADAGQVSDERARALKPVVEACLADTKELEYIMVKALPSGSDSSWERGIKALGSIANSKTVEKIEESLKNRTILLTFHQASVGPSSNSQLVQRERAGLGNHQQPCFMVKVARQDDFIGREDIIKEIDRRLAARQHRVAISGIGGVGKSQIAIEYCYRYKQTYPRTNVFWVYASSHARFIEAYQMIARELALPGYDNPEVDTIQLVLKWLNDENNGPWLMLLDNADDIEIFFGTDRHELSGQHEPPSVALSSYLSQALHGITIITTRDKRVGIRLTDNETPVSVEAFGLGDAKRLLQRTLRNDDLNGEESKALVEALGYLPMAITQAAAFIRENGITLVGYLASLQANDQEVKDLLAESYHDPVRDAESQNSVFQTWLISFENIRKQKPRAAEILSLMAVLDRQAVKDELLCKEDERKVDFFTAMGTLKAFSLIIEQKEGQIYGMHRLVQLLTQRWIELKGESRKWQEKALSVMCKCSMHEDGKYYDWARWEAFIPHIQIVLSYPLTSEECLLQRANILYSAAINDLEHGHFTTAEKKIRETVAVYDTHLEDGHKDRRRSNYILADVLERQGRYEAAEALHRRELETAEKYVGPYAADSITSLLSLAGLSKIQGRWSDFEIMSRQALENCEKGLESEHRLTFAALSQVAEVLKAKGEWEAAKEMTQRVFEGYKKMFGPEHPITLASRSSVAILLVQLGQYAEAEPIAREVFEGNSRKFGLEHPDTLSSLQGLSTVLALRGKHGIAKSMNQQALDGLETVLGRDHLLTLECVERLASLLAQENEFGEAESLYQRALDGYEKIFGTFPPQKLYVVHSLAMVLQKQEKHGKAEELLRQALASCETREPSCIESFGCMQHIGELLKLQGKNEEAEEMARKALMGLEESVGQNHPDTLGSVTQVALMLEQQGKHRDAEEMLLRAVHGYEESVGMDYLLTIHARRHLARVIGIQLKYDAAEPVARQALSDCERVLGVLHPDTVQSTSFLADVVCYVDKLDEAVLIYRKAYARYTQLLGAKDPSCVKLLNRIKLVRRQILIDAMKAGSMSKAVKVALNLRNGHGVSLPT